MSAKQITYFGTGVCWRHALKVKKHGTMNYYIEDKLRWNKAWENVELLREVELNLVRALTGYYGVITNRELFY